MTWISSREMVVLFADSAGLCSAAACAQACLCLDALADRAQSLQVVDFFVRRVSIFRSF